MSELTKDEAYKELQGILREKVLLVVGTGASMALDTKFGMWALSEELRDDLPKQIEDNDEAKAQWGKVETRLKKDGNLEAALEEADNKFLRKTIVRVSGNFLAELDEKTKLKILNDDTGVPIGPFIQKLVNGLPEHDPALDIITPNYDLLIEHGCDKLKIPYIDGFYGGIKKYQDWEKAERQMFYNTYIPWGKKKRKVEREKKHIRLHKVHGSLNWFRKGDETFEDNSILYKPCTDNTSYERIIITPGVSKFREAFMRTFNSFARANEAISRGETIVYIGYGFNDDHINKLLEKKNRGIIITKVLSGNAKALLDKSDDLWAVCHTMLGENEAEENHTLIYNKAYQRPLIIKDSKIWDIEKFSKEVLGE